MKKKCFFLFSGIAITAVFIYLIFSVVSAYQTMITGLIKQKTDYDDMMNRDMELSLAQEFNISGSVSDGNYNLTFSFPAYQVSGITISYKGEEETKNIKVKLPTVSGTKEEKTYSYLLLRGFTNEGAIGVMANLWKDIEDSSISDESFLSSLDDVIFDTSRASVIRSVRTSRNAANAAETWFNEFSTSKSKYSWNNVLGKSGAYLVKYIDMEAQLSDSYRGSSLDISFENDEERIIFQGTMDGLEIAGYFSVKDGEVSGIGYYGYGARSLISSGVLLNPFGTQDYAVWCEWSQPRNDGLYNSKAMYWNGMYMNLRFHEGCDLGAEYGTKLYAVGSGTVERATFNFQGYDGSLLIYLGVMKSPDGKMRKTWAHYGHISELAPGIEKGVTVNAGDYVARVGNQYDSNMPHLHLEIFVSAPIPDSQCDYCVDPAFYIPNLYKGQTGNCEPGLSGYPRGWNGYYRPDAAFLKIDDKG